MLVHILSVFSPIFLGVFLGGAYFIARSLVQSKEFLNEISCPGDFTTWIVVFAVVSGVLAVTICVAVLCSVLANEYNSYRTACLVILTVTAATELIVSAMAISASSVGNKALQSCVVTAAEASMKKYHVDEVSQRLWDRLHEAGACCGLGIGSNWTGSLPSTCYLLSSQSSTFLDSCLDALLHDSGQISITLGIRALALFVLHSVCLSLPVIWDKMCQDTTT